MTVFFGRPEDRPYLYKRKDSKIDYTVSIKQQPQIYFNARLNFCEILLRYI